MRKSFTILIALVLTLFTVPFGGLTAFAGEKVYDNIKDGQYDLDIKLLKKGTDEESAAASFMENRTLLDVNNDVYSLTFYIPKNDAMKFNDFILEEIKAEVIELDEEYQYTFHDVSLKDKLHSKVSYEVTMPPLEFEHDNIGMDIEILGLVDLPVKEDEPEVAEDERVVGKHLDEKDADTVYTVEFDSDSPATNRQLSNPVKVLEKGKKAYVQIGVEGVQFFRSLKFNGEEVLWNSITEGPFAIQYELENGLKGLESVIDLSMVIQAGPNPMPHDDIKLWFDIDTLEEVESGDEGSEEEEPEVGKDQRIVADMLKETDADEVLKVDYETDSRATAGQLLNPVTLLVKDGKAYAQFTINTGGAQFFRSLKFNGEEVVWNSVTEGPFVIQHELANGLDSLADEIDVSMVIQAGPTTMPHEDIKLWFKTETLQKIVKAELNKEVSVEKDSILVIDSKKGTELKLPSNLPEGVTLTVSEAEGFEKSEDLKPAGDILNFDFNGLGNQDYNFELTMHFDAESFNPDEYDLDIYYYDAETGEWIAQNGEVRDGSVTVSVEHFSIYGLFAKEKEAATEDPKEDPKEEPGKETETDEETKLDSLTPDKVYEVIYEILHEDGNKPSVADSFFEKPGYILEKDGVKYIQITVTDGEYVKALSNEYGDALTVKENPDGSVVLQLKLHDDLSNMLLDMHIVVGAGAIPGFPGYDAEHQAILFIDKDSLKEIDLADHLLAGTGDENNENGPFLKDQPKPDPEKPEFDDETEKEETEEIDLTPKTEDQDEKNPQTGVKTNLLLYTSLLLASLIPLAVQLRRRFA